MKKKLLQVVYKSFIVLKYVTKWFYLGHLILFKLIAFVFVTSLQHKKENKHLEACLKLSHV